MRLSNIAISILVMVVLPSLPLARQSGMQQVISTKWGYVSCVSGKVFAQRLSFRSIEQAAPGQQMEDGDQIVTEARSRAEILVNSAAYLRLDEQTRVRTASTRLTSAKFDLLQGLVMVQMGDPFLLRKKGRRSPGTPNSRMGFYITTPHGIVTVTDKGLYRIRTDPSTTEIDVYEGELTLGRRPEVPGGAATVIASPRHVELTDQAYRPVITNLKLKPYDTFDSWSFSVVKHGIVSREEGSVYASYPGQEQVKMRRVYANYQLRQDESLSTTRGSYVELVCGRAAHVRLNQESRLSAVSTDTDEAVYELRYGAMMFESEQGYPLRPVKIVTGNGIFAIESSIQVRFDVNDRETVATVHRGILKFQPKSESTERSWKIPGGKRLIESGIPPSSHFASRRLRATGAGKRPHAGRKPPPT